MPHDNSTKRRIMLDVSPAELDAFDTCIYIADPTGYVAGEQPTEIKLARRLHQRMSEAIKDAPEALSQ